MTFWRLGRMTDTGMSESRTSLSVSFWNWLDRVWIQLSSVKLTLVVLVSLTLLAIPGTVLLQYNISNVDPGLQYTYDFWKFGQVFQLFTAYHSFWYVALMVLLAMNLVACSERRWPQMWKLATAKPVALSPEAVAHQSKELTHTWSSSLSKTKALENCLKYLEAKKAKIVLVEDSAQSFQIFWHTGRWSRLANYLVHTSLLVIFAGAIISALYGFEGAANIPEGGAVDTLLIFKEGKAAGLDAAPGGLPNERLLGFRLEAQDFKVQFYKDWPGRPQEFTTRLNVLERGQVVASKDIEVNDPLSYGRFTFYQASYGKMGDFEVRLRLLDRRTPLENQEFRKLKLGEPVELGRYATAQAPRVVALRAVTDVQGLGPGVQFQELDSNDKPRGSPFWVLVNHPEFDYLKRAASYVIVLESVRELYFTGLQIGSDPGAPIYWLGCFGMLLGTFWALFVTHRRYWMIYRNGECVFVGNVHRLPFSFEATVARWASQLRDQTLGNA